MTRRMTTPDTTRNRQEASMTDQTADLFSYNVPDDPKMLRETLCVAQSRIGNSPYDEGRKREHLDRLQRLIDECDRQRPLGPDGKHNDRHTPTCGCKPDLDALPLGLRLRTGWWKAQAWLHSCPECGQRPYGQAQSGRPRWDQDPVARMLGGITPDRCGDCGKEVRA